MPKPPEPRKKQPSSPSIPERPTTGGEAGAAKTPAEPLAEVERALSILQGRHPDAVRAERETHAALANRKAESEAWARRAAGEDRRRWIVRGVVGVILVAAGVAGVSVYSCRADRARAVEASLAASLAPHLARGFARASASRFAEDTVELDASDPTCFVAFASRSPGDAALRVDRPSGALEGSDSVGWCTCGAERATVRLRDPSRGGLAVLRIAAPEVGGDQGLFFLEPRPKVIASPDECSRDSLDAWIDKAAKVTPKDDVADEEVRGALARTGFTAVASAPPSLPFAVVPATPDACWIALGSSPEAELSLRLPGGEMPVTGVKGALGFCRSRAANVTVWRKGSGDVAVERVSATRIGGTHGLREVLGRIGLSAQDVWVAPEDLAWDASATLVASGIAAPEISVSSGGRAVQNARLVALSIAGALVRTDAPRDAGYSCEPPLAPTSRSAVCVQSTALAWSAVGGAGSAGIAESALPFWMQAFAGTTAPGAMEAQLGLVKLARRLAADGFEATTLDGVAETPGGALVTGRAGDDAVVAVQLTRDAPWASPCSTGEAWALHADPAVVSLAPGAQVKLDCSPAVAATRDRRTVVFRHAVARPAR